jgi:hypothetical protein
VDFLPTVVEIVDVEEPMIVHVIGVT